MRLVGILLLSVLPILWGIDWKRSLRYRADFLQLFARFIFFVREQIRFSGREVEEIFSLALRDPIFSKPCFEALFRAHKNGDDLEKIVNDIKDIRLKKSDITLICGFLNGLGVNDVSGQMAHCDYYYGQCEQLQQEAQAACNTQGKLAIVLSLSGAAVLFILLI